MKMTHTSNKWIEVDDGNKWIEIDDGNKWIEIDDGNKDLNLPRRLEQDLLIETRDRKRRGGER